MQLRYTYYVAIHFVRFFQYMRRIKAWLCSSFCLLVTGRDLPQYESYWGFDEPNDSSWGQSDHSICSSRSLSPQINTIFQQVLRKYWKNRSTAIVLSHHTTTLFIQRIRLTSQSIASLTINSRHAQSTFTEIF